MAMPAGRVKARTIGNRACVASAGASTVRGAMILDVMILPQLYGTRPPSRGYCDDPGSLPARARDWSVRDAAGDRARCRRYREVSADARKARASRVITPAKPLGQQQKARRS